METINTRIVLRNDTKENWTTTNPILMLGEMGIEIDTRQIKVGDGISTWTQLPYYGADITIVLNSIQANLEAIERVESLVEALTIKVDTLVSPTTPEPTENLKWDGTWELDGTKEFATEE